MRVHKPDQVSTHAVYLSPAAHEKGSKIADWLDADGEPISFRIEFKHGRADVPDNLGQFMIDTGMASASPILIPGVLIC